MDKSTPNISRIPRLCFAVLSRWCCCCCRRSLAQTLFALGFLPMRLGRQTAATGRWQSRTITNKTASSWRLKSDATVDCSWPSPAHRTVCAFSGVRDCSAAVAMVVVVVVVVVFVFRRCTSRARRLIFLTSTTHTTRRAKTTTILDNNKETQAKKENSYTGRNIWSRPASILQAFIDITWSVDPEDCQVHLCVRLLDTKKKNRIDLQWTLMMIKLLVWINRTSSKIIAYLSVPVLYGQIHYDFTWSKIWFHNLVRLANIN